MTRDQLITNLAQVVAGMQVPVSLSMPLGTADAPLREIMGLRFGWLSAEEYEAMLREILGEACICPRLEGADLNCPVHGDER